MRFLKKLQLNKRNVKDNRVSAFDNGMIQLDSTNSLLLPTGDNTTQPSGIAGMIRYNTSTSNVEVYQGSSWRSLRFKESTGIVKSDLGQGTHNGVPGSGERYFGPLNSSYISATPASGVTWNDTQRALNILVIVGNVIQVAGTNYVIAVNPAGKTAGSYLDFGSSPLDLPPVGSNVIVLYGFDQ